MSRFEVSLQGGNVTRRDKFEADTRGDARILALRTWFGEGVFWDADVDIKSGRVVRAREVKRNGKVRFVEEPLTRFVTIKIRKLP